jgi:SHS2 domain-containing protein
LKGIKGVKIYYFMAYSFLEHTADVKFRADGLTLEDMFVSAAEALNEVIRGNIQILEQEEKSFRIEGKDKPSLLYSFLEQFLIMLDSQNFLVSKIKSIEIKDGVLSCVVLGDKCENYCFTNDVKAITYSEMFVREKELVDGVGEKGWECQVVLDV